MIIDNDIDCSNCEGEYFGESKDSLKLVLDEHKRSINIYACKKNWKKGHFVPLFLGLDVKILSKHLLVLTSFEDRSPYKSIVFVKI